MTEIALGQQLPLARGSFGAAWFGPMPVLSSSAIKAISLSPP